MGEIMRASAALLIGTSMLAVASPAVAAQTQQEAAAQAANPQPGTQPRQIEEGAIIVTATKRASTVQDVPFSVNAQTQADIQRANAQTIEDISRNVAGLTVQNLGPGQSQVSVRGVSAGQIVRDQPGVKEQVGIYLDESVISLSLFTPDFDLFDLNRVETLRGPQGTLFGSGSVGGTIRYITNQPRLERFEGLAEAGLSVAEGGDIGYDAKAALNIPISNVAAVRGVLYYSHFPGFIDSVGPYSKKNVNDGQRYGGRLSLLLQPNDSLKITPRLVWQRASANGFNREEFYNLFDNQFVSAPSGTDLGKRKQYLLFGERFRDQTYLTDITASYDFGPAELTSVSSYMHRDILVSRDASALTGSVTVSFASAFLADDPTSPRRPPFRRTCATRPGSISSPRSCGLPQRATARSSGCSEASTAMSSANITSGCPPRAMTSRPTCSWRSFASTSRKQVQRAASTIRSWPTAFRSRPPIGRSRTASR